MLLTLNDLDVTVRHHILDKSKAKTRLDVEYYRALAKFVSQHKKAHIIIVDKKDTNKKRQRMINQQGLSKAFKGVEFEESHKLKQLQAVDFVAWALGRSYEMEDSTFVKLIQTIME